MERRTIMYEVQCKGKIKGVIWAGWVTALLVKTNNFLVFLDWPKTPISRNKFHPYPFLYK